MVRLVLADDQRVVRDGLAAILGSSPEIEVVATAGNGAEAVQAVKEWTPDLVLMDLNMPVMTGVEATRLIKQLPSFPPVLVLTTYATDDWLFDALRAGADGYLLKDVAADELIKAVIGTAQGQSFLDPQVTGRVLRGFACVGQPRSLEVQPGLLSDKEREILGFIAKGYSNSEIADRVYLAPGTVRNYISGILTKLGAEDRTQVAVIALRAGLIDREN